MPPASRGGLKPKPHAKAQNICSLTFNTGMKYELGVYTAVTTRDKDVNKASLGTFFTQRKNPPHKKKQYFFQF